jgi:hypothetical protein
MAWWANLQIDALKEAKELWAATLLQADPTSDHNTALGTGLPGRIARVIQPTQKTG